MMPTLGSLLGSRVSSDVFSQINDLGHASIFGSEFDQRRNEFFMRYVQPVDQVAHEIRSTVNALLNPDYFRALESIEDLRSIPLCMEMAIATFAPIRQGIMEGRFEGFGYDPNTLPEDVFGRLNDNFTCEDVGASMDEEGRFQTSAIIYSDDPELSDDDLYAIRRTRDYLKHVLDKTDRDPTAIDLPRG
jgi:hypothetical protein